MGPRDATGAPWAASWPSASPAWPASGCSSWPLAAVLVARRVRRPRPAAAVGAGLPRRAVGGPALHRLAQPRWPRHGLHHRRPSTSCVDAWSPWPFVATGLLLAGGGLALLATTRRRSGRCPGGRRGGRSGTSHVDSATVTAYLDHAATTPMLPAALEALMEQSARSATPPRCTPRGAPPAPSSRRRASGSAPRWAPGRPRSSSPPAAPSPTTSPSRAPGSPAGRSTRPSTASSRAASSTTRCSTRSSTSPRPAGCRVTWLEPDRCGHIAVDSLREALAPGGVAVASVMWANNEVGTVQPVAELAAVAREHGVPFHTDAVQAVAHLPVRFDESGADLMTVSAHKIGGPVGVGALLARRDAPLVPDRPRWRAGAAGAQRHARRGRHPLLRGRARGDRVDARRRGEARHGAARPAARGRPRARPRRHGDAAAGRRATAPAGCRATRTSSCPGARATPCSTCSTPPGSSAAPGRPARPACRSRATCCSRWGIPEAEARGALRLSLGHTSTEADVDAFLAALPGVVERARRAGGLL